jgi:hypothetical protein
MAMYHFIQLKLVFFEMPSQVLEIPVPYLDSAHTQYFSSHHSWEERFHKFALQDICMPMIPALFNSIVECQISKPTPPVLCALAT